MVAVAAVAHSDRSDRSHNLMGTWGMTEALPRARSNQGWEGNGAAP